MFSVYFPRWHLAFSTLIFIPSTSFSFGHDVLNGKVCFRKSCIAIPVTLLQDNALLAHAFSKCDLWPSSSSSWKEILNPHPRPTELETLGWGSASLNKSSRWFWPMLKCENHCSRVYPLVPIPVRNSCWLLTEGNQLPASWSDKLKSLQNQAQRLCPKVLEPEHGRWVSQFSPPPLSYFAFSFSVLGLFWCSRRVTLSSFHKVTFTSSKRSFQINPILLWCGILCCDLVSCWHLHVHFAWH